MHAVYGGHVRVVRYLVKEMNADVLATSLHNGNTAMHYAFEKLKLSKNSASSEHRWQRLIRFLVENGAEEVCEASLF